MKFDRVIGSAASAYDHLFVIHRLKDGTPCIAGSSSRHASKDKPSVFVLSPEGGRTKTHPWGDPESCLYEVHPGDYIAAFAPDGINGSLVLYSLVVVTIGDRYVFTAPTTH